MEKINLEDGTIFHENKWLSVDDLTRMIQEKLKSNEMKFADMAAALEELKKALESSHTLSVNIVLSNDDYERLKELEKDNDRECIRKAIREFIRVDRPKSSSQERPSMNKQEKQEKKKIVIKCAKCDELINVDMDRENDEIKCLKCGARGLLKSTSMI